MNYELCGQYRSAVVSGKPRHLIKETDKRGLPYRATVLTTPDTCLESKAGVINCYRTVRQRKTMNFRSCESIALLMKQWQ